MICPVCEQQNLDDARFCGSCGSPLEDEARDVLELVGKTIGGRYLVKRVIGEGGMGVVYEAEQQMGPTVRRVAVKTLLPWMSKDTTIRSRFYREGGTVSQLEHPNTVRVYDFGEAPDGRLYIAMEFVRGEPLTKLIDKGPIAPERAREILRQVCGALEEAHAQGIVHRDLKPDNIVLTERAGETDFVKVLDFGIAAQTSPQAERQTKLTKQGMVLGTPPYMSPEQLAGEKVDARSDVYSLGVIAYEMLTGKLPFEADTPWQWAQKHMTETPRALTTVTDRPIPASMEHAVLQALAKRRHDRPPTAMQFYRLLSGEARVPTTEPDAPERTTPMPAPPDMSGRTEIGGVQPAFRTGAAVAAPIPPPPSRRRSGRWVGWALSLTGVAALGAIVASVGVPSFPRTANGTGGEPISGAAGNASSQGPIEIAPMMDAAPESPPMSLPPEPVSKLPPKKKTPGKVDPPPALPPPPAAQPPPAQPPPAQPPPAQPPPAQPPPAQPPPALPPPAQPPPAQPPAQPPPRLKLPGKPSKPAGLQGDAACVSASAAARGGNIEGAVSLFRTCASTGGSNNAQASARNHIRNNAAQVTKQRAFNGDCAGARSAANAASSIGEGAPAQAALSQTKC